MKALRLLTSSKKPISAVHVFSSSPAANPRSSNSFAADDGDGQHGSGVYAHKLKFQRPTTIKWRPSRDNCGNSASFMGTVIRPLRVVNTGDGGQFGVHTFLGVKNSPQSDRDFWILLKMWNEMAELSCQHLKQNDFIYVWGQLCSQIKADQNGNSRLWYELKVKELNYVAKHEQGSTLKSYEESPSDEGTSLGGADKYKDRILLWQMFLRNPYEWWDNRKDKRNAKQPDFKHKDTGDSLWLRPDDPPWIERQLQLLDMKMAEPGHGQRHSRVSKWEYDGVYMLAFPRKK